MPLAPAWANRRSTMVRLSRHSTVMTLSLNAELLQRIERALAGTGQSPQAACEQWVRAGLAQLEAQQASSEAAGRCSLRLGTATVGPVPLPVQQ